MTTPTPRPLEVMTAEKVLGWSVCDRDHSNRHEAHNCEAKVRYRAEAATTPASSPGWFVYLEGKRERLIPFLNFWAGLGLVVEAMEAMGWRVLIERNENGWDVEFERADAVGTGDYYQPTPWRAAFLASLRALGVPEEEINAALEVSDG